MTRKTLREWFDDYFDYRECYKMSTTDRHVLNTFVNWTEKQYPDELYPCQEMFDVWGIKRDTEHGNSHPARVNCVNRLIAFMNNRGCNFIPIEGIEESYTSVYRLITEEELVNVMKAADEMKTVGPENKLYKRYMTLALEMPVIIRLMYSSGPRPPEIRYLDRKDVDLENGIIYIRKGKGYNEHICALHPDIMELMRDYDRQMDKLFPNRIPFFPNEKGDYRSRDSLRCVWRQLCDKYNINTRPIDGKRGLEIYTLRHLYVTRNIENMPQDGYNKDIRALALSQSAGHSSVDITIKHYYHLTPRSGDVIDEKLDRTMDDIIPDIND